MRMRILIVGCGSIGMRHLNNAKALGHEVIAYRTSCDDVEAFESLHGVRVFTDYDDALDAKPDGIVISNPTNLHVECAIQAARRGGALLIEKPLSNTLEGIDILTEIVERHSPLVLVAYNLRFHKHVVTMKEWISAGLIGRVYFAQVKAGGFLPDWRTGTDYSKSYSASSSRGGGVVLDLSHDIDYILWFLGDVESVASSIFRLSDLEIGTEDYAELSLRFTSGAVAQIHLDYLNRYPNRQCELVGSEGTIKWDYNNSELRLSNAVSGEERCMVLESYERNDTYISLMEHFTDCIARRAEPLITIDDGVRVLKVALAAKAASSDRLVPLQ